MTLAGFLATVMSAVILAVLIFAAPAEASQKARFDDPSTWDLSIAAPGCGASAAHRPVRDAYGCATTRAEEAGLLSVSSDDASATKPTGPVSELEVGRYGDLAKRSVGDGMTPDHIPSNAARRANVEQQLGRELTPSEARALRDQGNCMVVQTCAHQQVSRTYGGRNSRGQITADAADLRGAANQDLAVWRQHLIGQGHSPAEVDAAIARLHAANQADGVYG